MILNIENNVAIDENDKQPQQRWKVGENEDAKSR